MREAVVFLPGLMADARAFGPQLSDLSRDHAVMCAPPSEGERVEEMASRMLDVLPKRFALVGHGLGGIVALEIVRRAPDRLARLALISTTPLAETPAQAAERDPRIIRAKTGRLAEALREDLPLSALAPSPYRAEIMALIEDMGHTMGVETYVRQTRALQRRRDQQGTVRRIAVPTLVLAGALDPILPPKRHEFLAELIPGAQLCILDDTGHMPMLEAPEATCDALRAWMASPLVLR